MLWDTHLTFQYALELLLLCVSICLYILAGGRSSGCPQNSGAAGTFYDAVSRSLIVSNHNMSTDTDTLLLEFPNQPLMTNVYIRNHAKAAVPLLWSRVQVSAFPVLILLNADLIVVMAVKVPCMPNLSKLSC